VHVVLAAAPIDVRVYEARPLQLFLQLLDTSCVSKWTSNCVFEFC
jgi:hypothetical protein